MFKLFIVLLLVTIPSSKRCGLPDLELLSSVEHFYCKYLGRFEFLLFKLRDLIEDVRM